jgi:hypothetical protein
MQMGGDNYDNMGWNNGNVEYALKFARLTEKRLAASHYSNPFYLVI